MRCSWGERGTRAAPLQGCTGPHAPQTFLLSPSKGLPSARYVHEGEARGHGETQGAVRTEPPWTRTQHGECREQTPCAWARGRVREGQEGFLASNVQAHPQKRTLYGCVSTYSFARHKKAKPLHCFASKDDGKLNWVLGFRVPGTGDSWILLKAIMAAERVCMGWGGVTASSRDFSSPAPRGGGGWALETQDRGREATCCLSVTFLFIPRALSPQWGVRRIYWNCIMETSGSQSLQTPRSHLHRTGCGAKRRAALGFGACGVARFVF